jgi:tetratricopeptide (TPR) repeat protein
MARHYIQLSLIVLICSVCDVKAQQQDLEALKRQVNQLYQAGKFAETIPIAQRALALAESQFGTEHLAVADALNGLALAYKSRGQYVEAEPLYKRNLAIVEKLRGASHPDLGVPLNNLAQLYRAIGRFGEAEQLLKRAIVNVETLGREHVNVSYPVNNLGLLYEETDRAPEAEQLLKRSLAIREKNLPPEHPAIAIALNNLGSFYAKQRTFAEAEALHIRALAIREKSLGPEHPLVGQSIANLSMVYSLQNRDAETEPLQRRGHAILEKALGANHPEVIMSLGNRAEFLRLRLRTAESEPIMRRYLEAAQRMLGPNHPIVANALHTTALLSADMGRRDEAEALFKQALAARERIFGSDHLALTRTLGNLGELYYFEGKWQTALDFMSRGEFIAVRRLRQGQQNLTDTRTETNAVEERPNFDFPNVVRARYRLAEQAPAEAQEQMRAAYVSAQWSRGSEAATSLAQMSVRQAKENTALARIVRERQDLIREYQARDKLLIAAASLPAAQRVQQGEQEQRSRLSAIDARLGEINKLLAKDFPEYKELTNPEPLSIAETQAQIRPDEALVLFLDAPAIGPAAEESFAWVVTKTDARWQRIERGPRWLAASVQALRCSLDPAPLAGHEQLCASLLKQAGLEAGSQSAFDFKRAHELYARLFGGFSDLIKDKHLLVVPSSALTALPLQVLLTEPPATATPDMAAFASAPWLARKHALTVLPSAAGLKLLRQFAKTSKATQPFLGFGNPLLLGPDGNDRRAWDRQLTTSRSHREVRS